MRKLQFIISSVISDSYEFKKSPHLCATLNLNFQFFERAERQVLLLGGSYQPKCLSFVDDWKGEGTSYQRDYKDEKSSHSF